MSETIVKAVPKLFNVSLDLKRAVANNDFEVVEEDTENYIVVSLTNDGEPVDLTGYRILAIFSHAQGSAIQDSNDSHEGITIEGNQITIHLLSNSFKKGIVECEIRIVGSPIITTSTTPTFNFSCRPSLFSERTVHSQLQLAGLSSIIQKLDLSSAVAEEALALARQSPKLHVKYTADNPHTVASPQLSGTKNKYMGICVSSDSTAPTSAKSYIWYNTNMAQITSAALNRDNELVFNLSDNSTINAGSLNQVLTQKQTKNLTFLNKPVSASDFMPDTTYEQFPYKVEISCSGVQGDMIGSVKFDMPEAMSGNYAPIALTDTNKVIIFAREVPTSEFNIPVIKLEYVD